MNSMKMAREIFIGKIKKMQSQICKKKLFMLL